MKIDISLLSPESVQNEIARLKVRKMHFEEDLEQLIDILVNEGAEVAQSAYGDFPVEAVPIAEGDRGEIFVYGDMPLIAEFGAGDATLDPGELFERSPETDVFPGSYSLEEGTREYWDSHLNGQGVWHFGGEPYTQVPPRQGLYKAKQHIIETSTETAREVMTYD